MKKLIFLGTIILLASFAYISYAQSNYFEIAKERISKYGPKRKDLVIIVDYRKNIFSDRLFVLDMEKNEIILSSNVSHAWNSGSLFPTSYSNVSGTNKTSNGNFITRGTKFGSFGYSMIIDGLDNGINNNARSRAIIFHSDRKMKTKWSNGCFATPEETNKKIIDLTKNGVLVCVIE
jgi:hypothetical protein